MKGAGLAAAVWGALLTLTLCAASPERASPVRQLWLDGQPACSSVVVGAHLALTAAHCTGHKSIVLTDQLVRARKIGDDLAELYPIERDFPPPYAEIGPKPPPGVYVRVEGYGCNPVVLRDRVVRHRAVRAGVTLDSPRSCGGLELSIGVRVCPGDSGGALWYGTRLGGIITATYIGAGASKHPRGYATVIP